MAPAAVQSSFDVAYWFVDRALNDNEYIQPQKLHRLMFLSQAYFAVAYDGRPLMPAVFVADQFGPIEPNVFRACSIQRPPIETVPLSEAVSQFLDSVWRRFGSQSANSLSTLVNGHPPYRDALDFDRLVSQGFVNKVIMTDRADMHANATLDLASRNRKLLTIKRKNLLFDERRRLGVLIGYQ